MNSRSVKLRVGLKPGDIGRLAALHGILYARECGFDHRFEAYVAGPLSEFALRASDRERIWIAERGEEIVGSIAIVAASDSEAQLRWFLVAPEARGAGLGRRLLDEAVAFCRSQGYRSVFLWTVSLLRAAAHLYHAAGFDKVAEKPGDAWGVVVIEEKYELALPADPAAIQPPGGTYPG